MSKAQIHLLELASSRYGIVVSPMLPSFLDTEEAVPTLGPHRHDYHALFLLSSGAITMRIEGQIIEMSPCSILIVQPGQIHQYIHSSNVSGWIMFLDGKILDTKVRTVIEQSKDNPKIIPLSGEEALFLDQILSSINQAAVEKIPGNFQTQTIHALANTLFYKTADLLLLQQNSNEVLTNRASKIVQDYKDLIKLNFKKFKRPAAYASLLHISVNHLNDCVKTQTGYSATRILQQEIIGEAQKQLRYSSNAVKEISSDLGYTDYKYFIRLFTKVTGKSPSVFRKTQYIPNIHNQ